MSCIVHGVTKSWTRLSDFHLGFPSDSVGKESACNAEDLGSIHKSGRSHGEGNGNPLQCSCLENLRDGGAWWAAVYGVAQSRTQLKRLSSSSMLFLVAKSCPTLCGAHGL